MDRVTEEVQELKKALLAAKAVSATVDSSYARTVQPDSLQINSPDKLKPWRIEQALEAQWGHLIPKTE
eukprot:11691764-Karenia_brevis.AAC.1